MKCIICQKIVTNIYSTNFIDLNYINKTIQKKKINFLLCKNCGLISRSNIDRKILDKYYSTISTHNSDTKLHANLTSFYRKRLIDMLKFIKISNKTKVLEVGCASGDFSSALIDKKKGGGDKSLWYRT